jgi:hypothetical protein
MAADPAAWGRAWHVPSPPPTTIRDLAQRYFQHSGHPAVKVRSLPRGVTRAAAPFAPMARELAEMDYQFYAPFVLDSSAATGAFGLRATDLDAAPREIAGHAPATAQRRM